MAEEILWQVVQERRVVFVSRRLQDTLQVKETERRNEMQLEDIGNFEI